MIPYHVVVLNAIEFSFQLPDFGSVSVHLLTGIGPIFIELIDNQRGIPIYHKVFDAELDGYTEAVETCFVFRGVVGSWEMNSKDVSELVLSRSNKQNAGTSTIDVEGTIEIHYPVFRVSSGDGLLDLGPFSDEVSQRP